MDVLHEDLVMAKIAVNREWNEYFHGGRSVNSEKLKQNKGVQGLFGEHKVSTHGVFIELERQGYDKGRLLIRLERKT